MNKFRTKLLIALITLIISVLVGLGILLGQLFKSYYLQSFNERLKIEKNLLGTYIEEHGGVSSFKQQDVLKISDMLNVRATITDQHGNILYDSGEFNDLSSTGLKKIIDDVVKKKIVKEARLEEGDGYDLHYYWKALTKDGQKEGYIFLSTKTDELNQAYSQIWWILSISLGIALIMILYLAIRITSRYTKPIEEATTVAIELAKGNYRARTSNSKMAETGMLETAINQLANNLQKMVKTQEMQQDRLTALIENIGAGLILIDSRGMINLINKGYIEIFQVNPNEYLNQLYYEVIEQKEICQLVAEVFRTEQKVRNQLLIPLQIERRYFDVYGVPIIGSNHVWKGVLLVFHDITEMKKLEQMRKDFVANVSHEIKTPVTSIKGFAETLMDGAMNNKETLEAFLSIILKESDRLQSLIQDLLELSKIEQQGFQLNLQQVDLNDLLHEVVTLLIGKAQAKNIHLELTTNGIPVRIKGDLDRLKQVFINIVSNAINYTPADGYVTVSVRDLGDLAQVLVKDSGVGIEKEEIPRIFERFYRVDRARSRDSGGTGLGLAIVKHLIEAHHGNIHVKSEVGKGSEFIIELKKQ
ncbi:PAS domain-containing protein [Neobacillus sp. YIM B02564]|jgi:two-component system phosphate regulon sensor histidine kinase PhoR|uniref:histidine kinase n=1 Tax=Neobacillus paridis TaxID=2803862 RepID=A0ABS1TIL6_9BACI|nr:ATP-binding protein [Neobacillus paridis]MBL4951155.1 PAS domain-containing protein [Neobacillus paridis]